MWVISRVLPLILNTDGQFNVTSQQVVKSMLINSPNYLSKILLQKHELKRRPMNLLPRQNGGKSESADKMVETWPLL